MCRVSGVPVGLTLLREELRNRKLLGFWAWPGGDDVFGDDGTSETDIRIIVTSYISRQDTLKCDCHDTKNSVVHTDTTEITQFVIPRWGKKAGSSHDIPTLKSSRISGQNPALILSHIGQAALTFSLFR